MEGRLAIDVSAVDIDFLVVEQGNSIMDVAMIDGVEHDVPPHLLYFAYHFKL